MRKKKGGGRHTLKKVESVLSNWCDAVLKLMGGKKKKKKKRGNGGKNVPFGVKLEKRPVEKDQRALREERDHQLEVLGA